MGQPISVLIISDSDNEIRPLLDTMIKGGYEPTYKRVETTAAVQSALKEASWDLVLYDDAVAESEAFSAIALLRETDNNVPLIILSDVINEEVVVRSMKAGASDYITKASLSRLIPAVAGALQETIDSRQDQKYHQDIIVDLRKGLEATVQAISTAVEIRDPYTAGHQRRVSHLACAIAAEMGLASRQIDGLRIASAIHDIGKMYIPPEILSKPAKLTEEEYNLIKKHPKAGFDILKDIDFPWPVARIVLEHHERIDGSGYPNGSTEEDLLLESMILAVSDVVEAVASYRSYRPAMAIDVALDEIVSKKGIHYNILVVDACLRLFGLKGYKMIP
ncbi:MAG: HD domain-containing protein [Deltaproteobacteria bacterium]|nr:HD domain-containing protein [Deltaproteobacteria bacterium]